MNKDVIYIDIEDDITAIIGKIKASKEKIVALVPPKRIGALQSAVNLRLLARMAEDGNKYLVIITGNKALTALAATAKIHIAKNLQSKPEMAEIPALDIDDGEDVIDGIDLPVSEHLKVAGGKVSVKDNDEEDAVDEAIETIDVDDETQKPTKEELKSAMKNKIKVPDFSRFRKKFFLGALGLILLIVFLVWANISAPAAKIIITAKTESAPISMTLNLVGTSATDTSKSNVQTITKQKKQDMTVDFTATGTKEVGEKATGTLTLSNVGSSYPINIPVGSEFTNSDYVFITTEEIDVPGTVFSHGEPVDIGMADVGIVAAAVGSEYNLPESDYESSISDITAKGTATVGGSSHTATVVTQGDIDKATQALQALSTNSIKQSLIKQFANGETVINDSFIIDSSAPVSTPALDQEVTDGVKAKLSSATTFTITAIAKSEIETYLNYAINKQIDAKNQRIYDNGFDDVKLSGYSVSDSGNATVYLQATGKIGPKIDETAIKKDSMGKNYGAVQSLISSIDGVSDVDIKFSYFWVTTVPNDLNKIEVEFTVEK